MSIYVTCYCLVLPSFFVVMLQRTSLYILVCFCKSVHYFTFKTDLPCLPSAKVVSDYCQQIIKNTKSPIFYLTPGINWCLFFWVVFFVCLFFFFLIIFNLINENILCLYFLFSVWLGKL